MSKWIDLPRYDAASRLPRGVACGGWIVAQMCPTQIHTHNVFLPKAYHFARCMEAGESFPPVRIFWDRLAGCWRASDGAHRVCAAKMLNRPISVRYRTDKNSGFLTRSGTASP